MLISEEQLERALAGSKSIREAWRKFSVKYYPVAWDTFRKNVHSYNETAKYFDGKTYNEKRVWPKYGLALYDMHVPHHDETVLDLAKNYVEDYVGRKQLDYLILGGDFLTCDSISRWSNDPSSIMPLVDEISLGRKVLSTLLDDFSPRETFYIKGNHEHRLDSFCVNNAPEIMQLDGMTIQEQLRLDEFGVTWVDNLSLKAGGGDFFSIGQLNLLHGHELAGCPSINPARRYFMKSFAPMMVGHVHKVDEHFERTIENKVIGTWVCGCACSINQQYMPHNNWIQGFAFITWHENGTFSVDLKKIINGMVV